MPDENPLPFGTKEEWDNYVNSMLLYRYFLYAHEFRRLATESLEDGWAEFIKDHREHALLAFFMSRPGIYLTYSYSAMEVVAQGWEELGLSDPTVDVLLRSPYRSRLRRFRNATFHFQSELFSPKHLELFGTEEEATEDWIAQLFQGLEGYFMRERLEIPEDLDISDLKSASDIGRAIIEYRAKLLDDMQITARKPIKANKPSD